ncbi:ubiquitin carboxyl-terminal hydrolase 10 isoform X2 [Brienomyrus brachyistius]|uniref:ubiquitin carboxyl-terminal hydrolase 10 isoform X2 n=1 Tax=Brienomyrus brachyistius TaxID=42636 RepID=UPI0020B3B741|nr:ubiquitin carboxyl-terminal hydrolase 10 isoform X2 [Brienomyrus brachyistius]
MASQSNQYIFGEFSPDEFKQFFVTPRCFVELPPFNDKVSCASQSSGDDFQHIEFGVGDVMDEGPAGVKDSKLQVSSTLNPQAPEFILACQSAPKPPPDADESDCTNGDSLGPGSEVPSLDGGQACPDLDGALGGLGQRERKKKKKRPPGYYNYLEGPEDPTALPEAPLGVVLVNGHSPSAPDLCSDDMVSPVALAVSLPQGNPGHGSPDSTLVSDQRTCESPSDPSLDVRGLVTSLSDRNVVHSFSHCSSGVAEGGRTPELRPESPMVLDNGQPSSTSPLPPSAPTISPSTTHLAEAEDHSDSGVVNGLADVGSDADGQKNDSEAGESLPLYQHLTLSPTDQDTELPSPAPQTLPVASTVQPLKSWASLFHSPKPPSGSSQAEAEPRDTSPVAPTILSTPQTPEKLGELKEGPVHVSEDPLAPRLADLIEDVKLIHKPVSLQPRGLINKGNWCYINATLQALIACPPMYHLMKSISMLKDSQRRCTSTPMIDNFVRLVNEFSNMPFPSKAKQQAAGDKIMKDVRPGVPFEPNYIYKLLTVIKSSLSEKGRQEDAEEYLGFILNGLHEEMLALKKLHSPQEEKAPTQNGAEPQVGPEGAEASGKEDSEDEWEHVGPRNKISVTRQAGFVRTPITDIFGGHMRSVVYQQSSKESATLQPFFTLQLDIQSEKIRTVQEALESLVARESVQGYTTKSKQEVEISRRVTLEELPPVLVLHLKRFVFEKTGGCQKLVKNIDYPIDLEISKDLLSPGVRNKIFKGQRTYRLFAVVYHHGNSATGGHYTTDVFHIGLNGWLRIDDQAVEVIGQYHVLKQSVERTAYLLYYRRLDLL